MAYARDEWRFRNSIEYEYKFMGRYGAKGEKRAKRKKATPEQVKEQNQRNREKNTRRLIKANFEPDDIWATLKYPRGTRKSVSEVKKDIKKCLEGMRYDYRKYDVPFKFIYRLEIGARGGIHIHMLLNRLPDGNTDKLLQKRWIHGRVNYESIYEQGGYKDLAAYIVKQPTEEMEGQLSLFDEHERKELLKVSSSRNLVRPKPERKVYKRSTVRKLIVEGPQPTPGYYIDKDSIISGINPYTGMSYYQYTEIRIEQGSCTRRLENGFI